MSYDILEAMTQIAREKNLDLQYVVETLESSLLSAAKKKFSNADNIFVKIDPQTGDINIHALRTVVTNVTDANLEISLKEAKEIDDAAEEGDEVEVYIPFEDFGRNAIATAKQLMIQKVREAEREMIYEEYSKKIGELVTGSVQQIDKGDLIVNLGRAEALLPSDQQIPREKYRQGERVRALIADVRRNQRGPQVILSRAHDGLVRKLFELEVPEIFERIIEIKAIAREPGERAKIAVSSADQRVDPVGACVGIKGVRVQSIVRELSNERIDIVQWHPDPEILMARALSPASVVKTEAFPEDQSMTVVVDDEKLSLAIGRQGQNARLAARLTGWRINIMSDSEYSEMKRKEVESKVPISKLPGLSEKLTTSLLNMDILYIQDLIATSEDDLITIPGIGPKRAAALIEGARQYLADLQAQQEFERQKELDEEVEEDFDDDGFEDEEKSDLDADDDARAGDEVIDDDEEPVADESAELSEDELEEKTGTVQAELPAEPSEEESEEPEDGQPGEDVEEGPSSK